VYQLGRSLAAIVQQVGVEIPGISNVVRLLAGAPASKAEAPFGFSNAGGVVGYAETGANAFSPLTKLTPMTRSPAAE